MFHFPPFPAAGRRAAAALLLGTSLATTLGTAACVRTGRRGPAAVEPRTTVRVQNQAFLDMNVYIYRGGARVRLGTATGNATTVLTVPAGFVQPGTLVRFMADPIGGTRAPVSEEMNVSPGDEVGLLIPPG